MSDKQIIALLRDIATSAPLPMEIHERIAKALCELLTEEKK